LCLIVRNAWGNNFVYYEEGNPKACFSPDCYVVFGVEKKERDTYKVWEEGGRLPSVVVEITSRKTKREDTEFKKDRYQALGIDEYYLFDPRGEYIPQRLIGYHLHDGVYVPVEPDVAGRLFSPKLNLELYLTSEKRIGVIDAKTGRPIMRLGDRVKLEAANARREAENARREAGARRAAEEEVARLKAELERLKKS